MTNTTHNHRTRTVLLLTALCLLTAGCGGATQAKVSGRVTLDGKPLSQGLVTFRPHPNTPGPDFSGEVVGGEYHVAKGVLPGDYVVDVRSWQKTGRRVKDLFGGMTDEVANVIPKRYWGEGTELTARLEPGDNNVPFDLQP